MRFLKLTLSYDGTDYAGWQVQANANTLQETLERALEKVTGEQVRVVASGRTDAGVHALGQVVSFSTGTDLPSTKISIPFARLLPSYTIATCNH